MSKDVLSERPAGWHEAQLRPGGPNSVRFRSFVTIELIDDVDAPCRGEPYEVRYGNSRVECGRLDHEGRARVFSAEGGNFEVRFPRLANDAWEWFESV